MTAAARREAVRELLTESHEAWLLTSRVAGRGIRTRPVRLFGGRGGPDVMVLTGATSRKAAEIELWPEVTLAGPIGDGWFAAEGTARVLRDSADVEELVVECAPGVHAADICVIAVTLTSARRWVVRSPSAFDNAIDTLLP
ncbi:pyridoxamine 5'-phosphate oxidase family protein [Demequina soli]|uniref:pyridoxamine 5'-phosphate oxidase family protein n=1 Tax=Demequina soli TaxID=1638987 RepID=UPI000782487C|nr:pyridoxamine 5'-phosphate oxidase family protein [Demequina soli]